MLKTAFSRVLSALCAALEIAFLFALAVPAFIADRVGRLPRLNADDLLEAVGAALFLFLCAVVLFGLTALVG